MFPKTEGKPPKWMVKIMENPIKMGFIWGENPLFSETFIYHIHQPESLDEMVPLPHFLKANEGSKAIPYQNFPMVTTTGKWGQYKLTANHVNPLLTTPPFIGQAPTSGYVSPRLQPILNKFSTPNNFWLKTTDWSGLFFCWRGGTPDFGEAARPCDLVCSGRGRLLIRYIQPLFNSMIGADLRNPWTFHFVARKIWLQISSFSRESAQPLPLLVMCSMGI